MLHVSLMFLTMFYNCVLFVYFFCWHLRPVNNYVISVIVEKLALNSCDFTQLPYKLFHLQNMCL